LACDKSATENAPVPVKDPAPAIVSAAPSSTVSAPPASPAAAAVSVATNTAVDAGKSRDGGVASGLKPASKRVEGNHFALELASPGCKAAADCALTIKLVASGEYHVNKEYPYKFLASAAPGVEFLGKSAPNTFTREAGDFVEQGEKVGTMTVRFRATAPGEARVAGTYKLSVCSADQCQIEQEKLELAVPVM